VNCERQQRGLSSSKYKDRYDKPLHSKTLFLFLFLFPYSKTHSFSLQNHQWLSSIPTLFHITNYPLFHPFQPSLQNLSLFLPLLFLLLQHINILILSPYPLTSTIESCFANHLKENMLKKTILWYVTSNSFDFWILNLGLCSFFLLWILCYKNWKFYFVIVLFSSFQLYEIVKKKWFFLASCGMHIAVVEKKKWKEQKNILIFCFISWNLM